MATKRLAHRAVRVVSIFAAAMMSPACEDSTAEDDFEPLPIEYVTDELEIATTFHAPLCGGDLDRFDTHVRRIDAVLGTEGTRTLYIYDNNAYPIPGCWEGVLGCFDPRHGVAMGLPVAVSHELVHAVSIDLGFPGHFWNEGLAEALSDHPISYKPAELGSLLDEPPPRREAAIGLYGELR